MKKSFMDELLKYLDNTTTNGSVQKMKTDAFTAGYELAKKGVDVVDNSDEIASLHKRLDQVKAERDDLLAKLEKIENISDVDDSEDDDDL